MRKPDLFDSLLVGYVIVGLVATGGAIYGAVRGVQALNKYLSQPEIEWYGQQLAQLLCPFG